MEREAFSHTERKRASVRERDRQRDRERERERERERTLLDSSPPRIRRDSGAHAGTEYTPLLG